MRIRIEDWEMAKKIGYNPKTTFWGDFSIAENFGENEVKDTFTRVFVEWKHDYVYLTELVMVLNHKVWRWYEERPALAVVYNELCNKADQYAEKNLKGEEAKYYYRTLD